MSNDQKVLWLLLFAVSCFYRCFYPPMAAGEIEIADGSCNGQRDRSPMGTDVGKKLHPWVDHPLKWMKGGSFSKSHAVSMENL